MSDRTRIEPGVRDAGSPAELSLHAYELESLEALTSDGIVDDGLGGCGVVFTVPLVLT